MQKRIVSIVCVSICLWCVLTSLLNAQTLQEAQRSRNTQAVASNPVANVENEQSDIAVLVDVDRNDRIYKDGDKVIVTVTSNESGYLYLFNVNPKGEATLLLPNRFYADNTIKANEKMVYPTKKMNFDLAVSGPDFGEETIKAFVVKEKLEALSAEMFTQDAFTALNTKEITTLCDELNNRKSIVVEQRTNSVAKEDYATGSVSYKTIASTQSRDILKPVCYAICCGVNKFNDAKINNLTCCENDAKAFAKLCVDTLGVDRGNCALLLSKEVTKEQIRHIFCDVLKKITKPGDVVFFYWSGHGDQLAATDSVNGSSEQFLIPYDGDTTKSKETMLMETAFGYWVQELNGRKIVMIIDACHSGGMVRDAKSVSEGDGKKGGSSQLTLNDFLQNSKQKGTNNETHDYQCTFGFKPFGRSKSLGQSGLYVLASSSFDQISWEGEEMSVMTNYLIEAIENGPKTMVHSDLKDAIKDNVKDYVLKTYNAVQNVVDQDDLAPGLVLKP